MDQRVTPDLQASKEIILCESLLDALTFWCAGFRNVTANEGINGFTDDHRAAFQKHGTTHVGIAYGRDEAGDAAARRVQAYAKKPPGYVTMEKLSLSGQRHTQESLYAKVEDP